MKQPKSDLEQMRDTLRYMNPEDIAKDFHSVRERAAIAAVFRWLSLNGICAWSLKRPGTYSTTAVSAGVVLRAIEMSDAIVAVVSRPPVTPTKPDRSM